MVEGLLQGGLGGLLALGLLALSLRLLARDAAMASELLGRTAIAVSPGLALALVVGGMAVGVAGSFMSLGRLRL